MVAAATVRPIERLETITSHLRSQDPVTMSTPRRTKVVVSRDLGPNVMPLLLEHPELEVGASITE